MFPYIELFGTKIYMTGLGIVIASIVFLITTYQLCKKYNQDFIKLFNRLPWLLITIYVFGLYFTSILDTGSVLPTSLSAFSPYGYRFNFVGILIACWLAMLIFLVKIRRNETKKIWIDIFFFGFINAVTALGFFLLLGESFMGKECGGALCVSAISDDTSLMKYEGVYPIGLFLSIGAVLINMIIVIWKRISKKIGLGVWGFVFLLGLLIVILPFWKYSAHGVWIIGNIRLDLYYYILFGLVVYFLWQGRRLKRPY